MMVMHVIPVHRCVELIASLTEAMPSPGFMHSMIDCAAAAVVQANLRIRTPLALAYAMCRDEIPILVGAAKAKKYLLVACTHLCTCCSLGNGTLANFKMFIVANLTGGVTHDHYQNYDSAPLDEHFHQLHASHLLSDLEDCARAYPEIHWLAQIQITSLHSSLRGPIHATNVPEQGRGAIAPGARQRRISSFRRGVRVGLPQVHGSPGLAKIVTQPTCCVLLEVLRDREKYVLCFAYDLNVQPINNQAEYDVRPAKNQQKISERLRSEQITVHRYAIRGYISTAAKRKTDVMTVPLTLCSARHGYYLIQHGPGPLQTVEITQGQNT